MAAASSQSARDRSGSLLARATCPWCRTRGRTRSLICLPAVCQLARDSNVIRSKSYSREWSFQITSLSIVGSWEFSVFSEEICFSFFFFFFLVHVQSDSKKRNRCFRWRILYAGGSRDLESFVRRFEVIWSNSRSPLFDFLSMVSMGWSRCLEKFWRIVEETKVCYLWYICIGIWDVMIERYMLFNFLNTNFTKWIRNV